MSRSVSLSLSLSLSLCLSLSLNNTHTVRVKYINLSLFHYTHIYINKYIQYPVLRARSSGSASSSGPNSASVRLADVLPFEALGDADVLAKVFYTSSVLTQY